MYVGISSLINTSKCFFKFTLIPLTSAYKYIYDIFIDKVDTYVLLCKHSSTRRHICLMCIQPIHILYTYA